MSVGDLMQQMMDEGAPLAAIIDAVRKLEEPETPARARRPSSKWRKTAYARVCERDGECCGSCGAVARIIWRSNGVTTGELWGNDPWESWRYTRVNPTTNLELDHRQPLSEGGTNDDSNLWLLCIDCHRAKTSRERSLRLKRLFAGVDA